LTAFFAVPVSYSLFQTFAVFWMLYSFFWVISRLLNFICRRFGTLCSIFIGLVDKNNTFWAETLPVNTPQQSRPSYSSCPHHVWRWNRVFRNVGI